MSVDPSFSLMIFMDSAQEIVLIFKRITDKINALPDAPGVLDDVLSEMAQSAFNRHRRHHDVDRADAGPIADPLHPLPPPRGIEED